MVKHNKSVRNWISPDVDWFLELAEKKMKELKISRRQLSKLAKINQTNLYSIFKKESILTLAYAMKIARVLDINLNDIRDNKNQVVQINLDDYVPMFSFEEMEILNLKNETKDKK